jgi:putative membrane protein insertion efficiency factor
MTRVRAAMRMAGTPLRALLIAGIRLYRITLSGWLGGQCRYSPTCSRYAEGVIHRHGAIRGSALAGWRLLRCNPFGRGGVEPVPRGRYDPITPAPKSAG